VNSLALAALEACSQPAAVAWVAEQAAMVAGWRQGLAALIAHGRAGSVPAACV
jgi:hypothetical protein